MFGDSRYGWAGLANKSGTVEVRIVEEVLAQVLDYDIEDILQDIYAGMKDKDSIYIPLSFLNESQINYPHKCRS